MANKTEASELIDYGVDTKNRRIYFGMVSIDPESTGSDFAWQSVEIAIRALHKLSETSKKPIELHMNSPGGSSIDMMRLYDEIQSCPCKIIFIGGGQVSSSATWIMAGCDERLLHRHTELIFHDGSDEIADRHTDLQIYAKATEDHMQDLYKIYADNSRMPLTFWQDVCQRDLRLSADETVSFGLADKVIEYKKRGNLRRSRIAIMNQEVDAGEMKALVKSVYKRIRRHKNLNKIEISVKKEEFDKSVIVDLSDVQTDLPLPSDPKVIVQDVSKLP